MFHFNGPLLLNWLHSITIGCVQCKYTYTPHHQCTHYRPTESFHRLPFGQNKHAIAYGYPHPPTLTLTRTRIRTACGVRRIHKKLSKAFKRNRTN